MNRLPFNWSLASWRWLYSLLLAGIPLLAAQANNPSLSKWEQMGLILTGALLSAVAVDFGSWIKRGGPFDFAVSGMRWLLAVLVSLLPMIATYLQSGTASPQMVVFLTLLSAVVTAIVTDVDSWLKAKPTESN